MTDPRDSFEPADDPGDATLERTVRHLRSLPPPPVPADLFAVGPHDAEGAPAPIARPSVERAASDQSRRRLLVVGLATLAAAIIVAVGIGVAKIPFKGVPREESELGQNVTEQADSPPDVERAPTLATVEPHPRLQSLADETAELKERVRALRYRAEATAARRQAERLLRQYAGR